MTTDEKENLRTAYRELCTSYRAIDDFRAKLLGFLPLATGTGIFFLLEKVKGIEHLEGGATHPGTAVGAFGFLITLGLFLYEIYGINKCGALIRAGEEMENSIGITNGQFNRRPQNVAGLINEPFAAGVIYPAVLAAWLFFALYFAAPAANPIIPIIVFVAGLVGTAIYDAVLRKAVMARFGKHTSMQIATWVFLAQTVVGLLVPHIAFLRTFPRIAYLVAALVYAFVACTFFFGVLSVWRGSSFRHQSGHIAHIVFYLAEVFITGGIFLEYLHLAHLL